VKASVYIETTIPSYLTAWRNPELVMAANQEATKCWWDTARLQYDIFISQIVVQESGEGDPKAAKRRLEVIDGLPELDISEAVENLANQLLSDNAIPESAKTDALHIAVATVHGIDYLLTWNCKHIANATIRPKIEAVCRECGYEPPVILHSLGTNGGLNHVARSNC
jgi:hypothetical protein